MPDRDVARLHRAPPGLLATRLDSDRAFPRHSHDAYGIGRIRAGGQRSWSLAGEVQAVAGDLIMVNPGEVHDGTPLGGGARRWQMLYLEPGLVESVARAIVPGSRPVPLWRPVARDEPLGAHFERLLRCVATGADELASDEALVALLACLFTRQAGVRVPRDASAPIVRARQRLDDDPATDPGLASLAAEAGLSRFQLLRAFSRELGLTPHAYLVQRRLALAQSLIGRGTPIAHAAAQAGFADQSHLTRLFTRCLGYTPAAYARATG
jgi:AraC-like DNA-binding protein